MGRSSTALSSQDLQRIGNSSTPPRLSIMHRVSGRLNQRWKIIRNILKIAKNPYWDLLEWRSSPNKDFQSPSEWGFSQRLHTFVYAAEEMLDPVPVDLQCYSDSATGYGARALSNRSYLVGQEDGGVVCRNRAMLNPRPRGDIPSSENTSTSDILHTPSEPDWTAEQIDHKQQDADSYLTRPTTTHSGRASWRPQYLRTNYA